MSHVFGLTPLGKVLGIIENYESLEWSRNFYSYGSFTMEVNRKNVDINLIRPKLILAPFLKNPLKPQANLDSLFLIEQMDQQIDQRGSENDKITLSGRDLGGMFADRLVIPPSGSEFDLRSGPAESVMKEYVNNHAAIGDPLNPRSLSNYVIATDTKRGPTIIYQARFQTLAEVLEDIAWLATMGWEVVLFSANNTFNFNVIPGVDRRITSKTPVVFDVDLETALSMRWVQSELDRKTVAYVGGRGEATGRPVVKAFTTPAEPSGFDRREVFVDAGDLEAPTQLVQRGKAELLQKDGSSIIDVKINPISQFQYRRDWDLGDIVTVRNQEWGVEQHLRIVEIKIKMTSDEGKPEFDLSFERTSPSLTDRILERTEGTRRK